MVVTGHDAQGAAARSDARGDALESAGGVMTVSQLSRYLQVSTGHVYEMARTGQIPAIRLGRKWRFRREQIDRWLDDLTVSGECIRE
jgi:excisionase family DNA binding protein